MKATIKYDKKDTVIFCDESGNHILKGDLCSIVAIYSSIGVAIKEQLCKNDDEKKGFNYCIELLLKDKPSDAIIDETLNKIEKVNKRIEDLIKEIDKED